MNQINPFHPQSPISKGMFVGRRSEIMRLESVLTHAKHQQPINFMITGERGIGKTSLLYYVMAMAKSHGEIDADSYNFLTVSISIDETTSQLDFVRKIETSLRLELESTEVARTFLNKTWAFLQRIEFSGFSIDASTSLEAKYEGRLIEECARSLVKVVSKTCNPGETDNLFGSTEYDGLLVLVDEVDQANQNLQLGRFLKLLTENLHRQNCRRITIGLSGLDTVPDRLTQSHRSSLRIFEEIPLSRLSETETNELIDVCLDRGDLRAHRIEPRAREALTWLAEGHPHFLHQFGYCAFNKCAHDRPTENAEDNDNLSLDLTEEDQEPDDFLLITRQHVLEGALSKRGALEIIGDMYFAEFYRLISNNDLWLNVVLSLCGSDGKGAHDVATEIKGDAKLVQRALAELSKSELILHDQFANSYRVLFSSFGHWIQMKTPGITLHGDLLSTV